MLPSLPPIHCGFFLLSAAVLAVSAQTPGLGESPSVAVPALEGNPPTRSADASGGFSGEHTEAETYLDLFTPLKTEQAAISPDGERVAYTRRVGEDLWVTIVEVANPGEVLFEFIAVTDTAATPVLELQAKEKVPGQVEWMGWVTSDRLVIQTNQIGSYAVDGELVSQNYSGFIYATNADGSDAELIVDPMDVASVRAHPTENEAPSASNRGPVDASYTLGAESTLGREEPLEADASIHTRIRGDDRRVEPIQPMSIDPRSPMIIDYSPDNPEEIWVRAGTKSDFELFAINVFTGKKRILQTERAPLGRTVLLDRQQHARIVLPSTPATDFPHVYQYDTGRFLLPWKDLESLIETDAPTRFSLAPDNVMANRSIPLGFDEDPDLLYFASDLGRETFGIYALQLSSGKLTDLAIEHPAFDLVPPSFHNFEGRDELIFDRYSRQFLGIRYNELHRTAVWLRPAWQQLQDTLEQTFAGASVDILDWDESRERFLVRVQGTVDAGGFYIFNAPTAEVTEFARTAPQLDELSDAWTAEFVFEAPDGRPTRGRLTVPTRPITTPVPMIILCPDNFWNRLPVDFDREALALARMGYVVAQFNGRGAWGFGKDSRTAIQQGYETAQAAELVAMVDFLKERFAIDPGKVALMGEGLGGFLALRSLQEFPDRFRGAIAINAPFNLHEWVQEARWNARERPDGAQDVELIVPYLGDAEHLSFAPLVDAPETMLRPVQLFAFRKEDGTELTPDYNHAFTLARTLRGQEIPVELVDLHRDYLRGLPHAHAGVFAKIAQFLDTHLFEYEVTLGELEYEMDEE